MTMARSGLTGAPTAFALTVLLVLGMVAAYSSSSPPSQPGVPPGSVCSQPPGVVRDQLDPPSSFGAVVTYQLPKPLRAPNSIVVAADGSVWFGEVGLRGVAHLFSNGTLLEYAWPRSTIAPGANCLDILELWGLALWHGMVWASDPANDQLVGLFPSNDTFVSVHLADGVVPRFLTVDANGNLWFTEASTPTAVGVLDSPTSAPRYFEVPAHAGEISASLLVYNSSLAYVATVNPANNSGGVFSFDPSSPDPVFEAVGPGSALIGPYSVAVGAGGLWASEHDSSGVASYDAATGSWTFVPTSVNPDVALTLPYYMVGNGSSVWFTEQTGNRIGELAGTSLTEFNISSRSMTRSGVENALTLAVSHDLVWFTEWTGDAIGFVNASAVPTFSLTAASVGPVAVAPGSSTTVPLAVTGSSSVPLSLEFSDSERNTAVPANLTISANASAVAAFSGVRHILLRISAAPGTPAGTYLVLSTVTDGMTYRSVYLAVTVS